MKHLFPTPEDALRFYTLEAWKRYAPPPTWAASCRIVSVFDERGEPVDTAVEIGGRSCSDFSGEDRICLCVDIERCLPRSVLEKALIIGKTIYPWRHLAEKINADGRDFSLSQLRRIHLRAMQTVAKCMAARGVSPDPWARSRRR